MQKIKIFNKKISKLTSGEINEIKSFLIDCFDNMENIDRLVYSNEGLDYCIIARDQSKRIIAHASLVKKTVRLSNKKYLVGGVGNVAIDKKHRHQGLGLDMLKRINKILIKRKYDLGMLFCVSDLEVFYSKSGWIKKTSGKVVAECDKDNESEDEITFIYPITIDRKEIDKWTKDSLHIGKERW